MSPKVQLSCKVKKPSVPNIIHCPICGLSQAVDSAGTPYYPHRHDEINRPSIVSDQWGNYIGDLRDPALKISLRDSMRKTSRVKRW